MHDGLLTLPPGDDVVLGTEHDELLEAHDCSLLQLAVGLRRLSEGSHALLAVDGVEVECPHADVHLAVGAVLQLHRVLPVDQGLRDDLPLAQLRAGLEGVDAVKQLLAVMPTELERAGQAVVVGARIGRGAPLEQLRA